MPHLGAFVPSSYFAFIYVPAYSKHHLPGPFLIDPLADELLRQFQGREDVGLKSPADEINRNFTHWTVFADPGIAEKNVNVPFQRVGHIVGMEEI